MKKWKRFGYAVVIFAIIVAVFNFPGLMEAHRQRRNLEKTFRDYTRALESRDYSGAYAFGDSPFKASVSPQDFSAQQGAFDAQFGILKSISEGGFYMHGRGSPTRWIGIVEEIRDYEKGKARFVCGSSSAANKLADGTNS